MSIIAQIALTLLVSAIGGLLIAAYVRRLHARDERRFQADACRIRTCGEFG